MKSKKGKIIILSFFILTGVFFLSGCALKDVQLSVSEKLKSFNDTLGDEFNGFNKRQKDSVMDVFKEKESERAKKEGENLELSNEDKEKIDNWLEREGLNKYGDTEGVYYPDGTPLVNKDSGESIERYQYLLKRYPDLLNRVEDK